MDKGLDLSKGVDLHSGERKYTSPYYISPIEIKLF